MAGSAISDNAEGRRFPMAVDLAYRSYYSSTLWDTFLKDIPEIVTPEHITDLHNRDEWKKFMDSWTGGEPTDPFSHKPSGSNEKEFKKLIQCIAGLEGLDKYFKNEERDIDNPRCGRVRISHQGNKPMTTWNTNARWLRGNCGSTVRQKELKPDLMSTIVEDAEGRHSRAAQQKRVQLAIPQTISPPPDDWQPWRMTEKEFPIVEIEKPVWECLDLFWECKRNSQVPKIEEVYIDCALKAAEALRYQWSRRYIYCFLHCGKFMQLLHFDRSGLMASEQVDITSHVGAVMFVRCLLAVFLHKPGKLGYPAGDDVPVHGYDPDDRLRQIVTVNGRQMYLDDQEVGPPRDHLVSRATVVFKAKFIKPQGDEKTGWDYCYKTSWVQKLRRHEGQYLERLRDVPNVVKLLGYGVVKVEDDDDTTAFGRQSSSGKSITVIENYYERAKALKRNFNPHSRSAAPAIPGQEGASGALLFDPRRPEGESPQDCDDREHRYVVTDWVKSSFNEAASSLDSGHLPTIISIWQQAFSAIKSICDAGILHRDISFRNIRVDDQHEIKVCDFDMATFLGDQSTGAKDRTGTIAFMATSMLLTGLFTHRPIHDCESIFWLCTLDLLWRIGIGVTRQSLANIMDSGQSISQVIDSKRSVISVMSRLSSIKRKTENLKYYFSLDDPKDSSLFFCLTMLAREFVGNNFDMDYEGAEEGFEDKCFGRCIEIIEKAKL